MVKLHPNGEKFPLSFSATKDAANNAQLVRAIRYHITLLQRIGFTVVETLCDQGGANRAAIRQLIAATNRKRTSPDGKLDRPCK